MKVRKQFHHLVAFLFLLFLPHGPCDDYFFSKCNRQKSTLIVSFEASMDEDFFKRYDGVVLNVNPGGLNNLVFQVFM